MSVPFYGFMSATKLLECRIQNSDLMLEAFNNEANKENIKP
jgi:hypothetical protein